MLGRVTKMKEQEGHTLRFYLLMEIEKGRDRERGREVERQRQRGRENEREREKKVQRY